MARDNSPIISPLSLIVFCHSVEIFFTYSLISSVCIMTMMGYFKSLVDNAVGIVVFITVIASFMYCTRTMISSGF